MSAATESDWTVGLGDVVFVHPEDEWASAHLQGVQGTVIALEGLQAQIELSSSSRLVWVDARLLRRNRRRPRRRVRWDTFS